MIGCKESYNEQYTQNTGPPFNKKPVLKGQPTSHLGVGGSGSFTRGCGAEMLSLTIKLIGPHTTQLLTGTSLAGC